MTTSNQNISKIQKQLLQWFASNARTLPWRTHRTPYTVLVSEFMLQQTQVATVIPYFQRFIKRFPTIEKLARARIDSVLKLWEGLGYYQRARNLHKTARIIVNEHGGRFPQTKETLMELPGIGSYIGAAVASIAFGENQAVVDGNVLRVLCRLFRIKTDPKENQTKKKLDKIAQSLLPTGRAGAFNEAMMELGATVCTPKNPLCEKCPIKMHCKAQKHNEQDTLPAKAAAKAISTKITAAAIIIAGGYVLIRKRGDTRLLAGLWEFPNIEISNKRTMKNQLKQYLKDTCGLDTPSPKALEPIVHIFSHFRLHLHGFEYRLAAKPPGHNSHDAKWVRITNLKRYAFPRAHQKLMHQSGLLT